MKEENVFQINGEITKNVDESVKYHLREKGYIWNSATFSCKNGKDLASIIDNSVITCDKIIEEKIKTVRKYIIEKKCNLSNKTFLIFACLFINYHCIIDSC